MPKLKKPLSAAERIAAREALMESLDRGDITIGQAIRKMRLEWTGLSQGQFGKPVGVSANTLSAIERDADNANTQTLRQILRRFGMVLTIRPTPEHLGDGQAL